MDKYFIIKYRKHPEQIFANCTKIGGNRTSNLLRRGWILVHCATTEVVSSGVGTACSLIAADISGLPGVIQEQLFSELVDGEVQRTLEPALINWSVELRAGGSRLHALWNRSAGDCLPDAVCQAALGVCDRDNTLRAAMHATLTHAARPFLARFTAWERLQAARLHYAPADDQLRAEWARLVDAAPQPGTPLHQVSTNICLRIYTIPLRNMHIIIASLW